MPGPGNILTDDELKQDNIRKARAEAEAKVKAMQEEVTFTPAPVPKNAGIVNLMETIPLFSGLASSVATVGSTVAKTAVGLGKAGAVAKSAAGFGITSLALDVLDFVRIPLVFLAAAIFNEKGTKSLPLKEPSNWLKLGYAGVLLGLTISAFAFPAAAPFIAIGAAGTVLAVGAATMIKVAISNRKHKKELARLEDLIGNNTTKLENIKKKASELDGLLQSAIANKDDALITQHTEAITELNEQYESTKTTLQGMYDSREVHRDLLKKNSQMKIVDKGMGLLFGGIAISGLILAALAATSVLAAPAIPAVASALIIAGAVGGAVYAATRFIGIPLATKVGGWLGRKLGLISDPAPQVAPSATNQIQQANANAPSSVQPSDQSPAPAVIAPPSNASVQPPALLDEDPVIIPEEPVIIPEAAPVVENKPKLVRSASMSKLPNEPRPAASLKRTESTGNIAKMLFGDKGADVLNNQLVNDKWIDKVEAELANCVKSGQHSSILKLFKDIALHNPTTSAIDLYMSENKDNKENWQQAFMMLNKAIDDVCEGHITFTKEDRAQLLAAPGLQRVLHSKGVDLQRLAPQPDEIKSGAQASPVAVAEQNVENEQQQLSSSQ